MLQPFRLKPRYIVTEHCQSAASAIVKVESADSSDDSYGSGETSSTPKANETGDNLDQATSIDTSQSIIKQKENHTGPLTRNKISSEAVSMLYRLITSVQSRSRYANKLRIFYKLTYLFDSWSHYGCQVNPKSLTIKWRAPRTGDIDNIDGLAITTVICQDEQRAIKRPELGRIGSDNVTHLKVWIADHPGLP